MDMRSYARRLSWAAIAAAMCAARLTFAAERLPIETEPQSVAIHPIAPEDGAEAVSNPPAMVFWWTGEVATYTVEMAQDVDFGDAIVVADIELPFYNHSETLKPGTWYWRYYFETEDKKRSEYSPVRSFVVTGSSIPFPMPPVGEVLMKMPGHPRIYTTRDGLAEFRARKGNEARGAYEALMRRCESWLESEPEPPKLGEQVPKNPKQRGIAFWLKDGEGYQSLNVSPGTLENLSLRTQDLAMAYLITGERQYADAARRWLLWQANFRVDYHQEDRAHHDTVHCYEYGLQRMASAYDSIYDVLTEDERQRVLDAVEYHGQGCYDKLRYKRRMHLKYQTSHAQQDMHELLTTALAVAKDLPAAKAWLEYLIPQYVNRLAWGENDGGYSEGHYYNYKWHGMVRCAQALRTATGIDLLRKPRFVNAGRFWLYCMSLNYWWPHFGDNFGLITPFSGSSNDRDGANFLASVYQDRYMKWWANQIDAGLQMPLWYLSDEGLKDKPPVDIPQAAAFGDVGWVSMYDRFYDNRSTRLFFKCSPWGSHSHCHKDQNGFVIHAFGEILAIDKGYYGYYGDDYHKLVCQATKSHNTILVNGEGQGRGIQYNGHISDFFDSEDYCFVIGDASAAYGERLSKFLRAVLFIRPNCFIIYDQLEAPEASRFSWQLNAFLEMELDEGNQTVTIEQRETRLRATHVLPGDLAYRQSNEREYELKARYTEAFPEHWTCWCERAAEAKEMRFLTVLEAYKVGDGPAISNLETIETEHLMGVVFELDGERHTTLFQRDLVAPVRAEVGGIETDAKCVSVVRNVGMVRCCQVGGRYLRVDGQTRLESETPGAAEWPAVSAVELAKVPPVSLAISDSDGTHEVPLEVAADAYGHVFYFARLDPREQGRYEFDPEGQDAEILVEDRWDPEHSSRGTEAELRAGSMVIIRADGALPARKVAVRLKQSYRGQVVSLLRNGGFEVGIPEHPPIGWWVRHFRTMDPSFPHWSDEDPAEGAHCLKLVRATNKIRTYSQGIELRKAGRYILRCKAKATCAGGAVNTWGSAGSMSVSIEPSEEWKQYEVEGELGAGTACIHCIFDKAEGPNQVLWVDDIQFGRIAD